MELHSLLVISSSQPSSSPWIAPFVPPGIIFSKWGKRWTSLSKALLAKEQKQFELRRFIKVNLVAFSSWELHKSYCKENSWRNKPSASHVGKPQSDGGRKGRCAMANAVPTVVVSAVATVAVVGAAVATLARMNQEKIDSALTKRKQCEVCNGSGSCSLCNGEGFILKNLSPEAVARARANAKDAATRYTSGLAKKWSYCANCSGSRNCPDCQGRGWVE